MLPPAETSPAVAMLPAVRLPAADNVPVPEMLPLATRSPPVTVLAAESCPVVWRFPVTMLPVTLREGSVPTDVAVIPVSALPLPL